jgi:hypothetical protein
VPRPQSELPPSSETALNSSALERLTELYPPQQTGPTTEPRFPPWPLKKIVEDARRRLKQESYRDLEGQLRPVGPTTTNYLSWRAAFPVPEQPNHRALRARAELLLYESGIVQEVTDVITVIYVLNSIEQPETPQDILKWAIEHPRAARAIEKDMHFTEQNIVMLCDQLKREQHARYYLKGAIEDLEEANNPNPREDS